jgi:ABC-type glutathione transport system ATPase component
VNYDIYIATTERTLVDISDFELNPGTLTFLLGESGIGKTLISKAIFGLLPAMELDVTINDQGYTEYISSPICTDIQKQGFFVFQEPSSHLNPMRTLAEQLNEGSIRDTSANKQILSRLFPAFSEAEREHLLSIFPKPYRPSGGEKQRILIAMAFKKMAGMHEKNKGDSPLFIFDEPTGNLDDEYRNIFLKMLITAQQQLDFTALLITHDYSMITEIVHHYPDRLPQIDFQELSMKNDELQQLPFSADMYVKWLDTVEPVKYNESIPDKPKLSLHETIHVFDRRLTVTADPQYSNPCALEIYPGDAVYLKAGSGVGKTTLAKIVMGLQSADKFLLTIDDLVMDQKSLPNIWKNKVWAKTMAMVFQHADEALNLNGKVKDIFRGLPLKDCKNREFLIKHLKLIFDDILDDTFLDRPVARLSGGQKQRLNLIRALILDTDILILDEPFNGLDFMTLQKVLALLQERQAAGKSFLIISHNEEIIDRLVPANRVYYLRSDRI